MAEQKKEEQIIPPIKKQHSYTYWVDEKTKSRQLPEQHKPKKIQGPLLHELQPLPTGPSKWNTSGTWQERSVPMKELNETVKQAIQQWLTQNQCELTLNEVNLEGEFKQIFSNNKRKVLYEITGKINFEGQDLQIKIHQIACSGDRQIEVKGKSQQQKAKLSSVANKIIDVVVQTFGRYKE